MEKIIPILPCSDEAAQTLFYNHLGFELCGKYIRSYLVFRYNELEIHFYGSKIFLPQENPSMCCVQTDALEQLYSTFTARIKANTGRIPRSGFPRISKIRDLSDDRRFTLTDPSGNTIYFIQQKEGQDSIFFREISNKQYAEKFAILYDLIYSKEDLKVANNLLPGLLEAKKLLGDLDRAKLLILTLEIYTGLGVPHDNTELEMLLAKYHKLDEWKPIKDKLAEIRQ